jgi:hypothetical protein
MVTCGRCGSSWDHLQNRWSASLAMSTDGSFPSRPRQSLNSWAKVTIAQDEKQSTNRHPAVSRYDSQRILILAAI